MESSPGIWNTAEWIFYHNLKIQWKILYIFSDVDDFPALLLQRPCPEVDHLAPGCIWVYTSITGMPNWGILTPFNSLHMMLVASKFYTDSLFWEKNIHVILNTAFFPTNLKAAVKQCRDRRNQDREQRNLFHSESCLQVTFGWSFNLSRMLFFHPLHEGLRLDDDSAARWWFQTERTFRKQIKWNNSYDGRQSILVQKVWIWSWRGFRTQLDGLERITCLHLTSW